MGGKFFVEHRVTVLRYLSVIHNTHGPQGSVLRGEYCHERETLLKLNSVPLTTPAPSGTSQNITSSFQDLPNHSFPIHAFLRNISVQLRTQFSFRV